jgi:DUF1680 family protein
MCFSNNKNSNNNNNHNQLHVSPVQVSNPNQFDKHMFVYIYILNGLGKICSNHILIQHSYMNALICVICCLNSLKNVIMHGLKLYQIGNIYIYVYLYIYIYTYVQIHFEYINTNKYIHK